MMSLRYRLRGFKLVAMLVESDGQRSSSFRRTRLRAGEGAQDEKWLQTLLFARPDLVILDRMEADAGAFVPIVRELPLAREGGVVFLDILGISRSGRLVLVECKLWRNPQARREVIAQILEYAALARGLSYSDLTAKVRQSTARRSSANPIYELARQKWPDLDESVFVDAVSRSLDLGDFHLIVAGDGIRSDLHAISDHLNASGLAAARFSLLEIQLWKDDQDRTLIVPSVPVRTEVIQQRVLMTETGRPLRIEETGDDVAEASEQVVDPEQAKQRTSNRIFWQSFIDTVKFDHPDQPVPRHGGNNWVRVPLPEPVKWMTAYRSRDKLGLFLALSDNEGFAFYEWLEGQADALRQESGLPLTFEQDPSGSNRGQVSLTVPKAELVDDIAQLEWLRERANRLVTLFRPLISRWVDQAA